MQKKLKVGYMRSCDVYGCTGGCNDMHANCKQIPVLLVPLDEVEMEAPHMNGRIQFGDANEVAPWTARDLAVELEKLPYPCIIQKDG